MNYPVVFKLAQKLFFYHMEMLRGHCDVLLEVVPGSWRNGLKCVNRHLPAVLGSSSFAHTQVKTESKPVLYRNPLQVF